MCAETKLVTQYSEIHGEKKTCENHLNFQNTPLLEIEDFICWLIDNVSET
jgi:hypothetical protein